MFYPQDCKITEISFHNVGNKTQNEFYILGSYGLDINKIEGFEEPLRELIFKPFTKVNQVHKLFHQSGEIQLNEVHEALRIFYSDFFDFLDFEEAIIKHLYETHDHPKIKRGDVIIVYMEGVQFEGEERSAIGIFKIENKSTFLQVDSITQDSYGKAIPDGISLDKLDKGVIIINTSTKDCVDFDVLVHCEGTAVDRQQWVDEFYNFKFVKTVIAQLKSLMLATRVFVNEKVDETFEISAPEKAVLANKTLDYFKSKETFDLEEFKNDVLQNQEVACNAFESNYQDLFEEDIPDQSEINAAALKKQQSKFKQVIKLDKNFVIEIKGKNNLMESGFDEEKGKNYYKVYFDNEN